MIGRMFIKTNQLFPIIFLSLIAENVWAAKQCCSRLYVGAKENIAKSQGIFLGIYNWTGIYNDVVYYTKIVNGREVFLYMKEGDISQPSGWSFTLDLDSDSIHISTGVHSGDYSFCPSGIQGGYDELFNFDPSFKIECHDDAIKVDCCSVVNVNSSSTQEPIAQNQGVFLGTYRMIGGLNGFPIYEKREVFLSDVYITYLYFNKNGNLNYDGWCLSNIVGYSRPEITTRQNYHCPNDIQFGYDRNIYIDNSFTIKCNNEFNANNYENNNSDEILTNKEEAAFIKKPQLNTTSNSQVSTMFISIHVLIIINLSLLRHFI